MPITIINQPGAGVGPITSTSSNLIGTGSKTFIIESGLAISTGAFIVASDGMNGWMEGTVTSYSGTSLVTNITQTSGSGTFTSWTINVAPQPVAGAWVAPTLTNGTTPTSSQNIVRYRMEADGVTVRLSGAVQSALGPGIYTLFTLPSGFRPVLSETYPQYDQNNNITTSIIIATSGIIQLFFNNSIISLEGTTFSTV